MKIEIEIKKIKEKEVGEEEQEEEKKRQEKTESRFPSQQRLGVLSSVARGMWRHHLSFTFIYSFILCVLVFVCLLLRWRWYSFSFILVQILYVNDFISDFISKSFLWVLVDDLCFYYHIIFWITQKKRIFFFLHLVA